MNSPRRPAASPGMRRRAMSVPGSRKCAAWEQVDRYHELARALAPVDDWPTIARA